MTMTPLDIKMVAVAMVLLSIIVFDRWEIYRETKPKPRFTKKREDEIVDFICQRCKKIIYVQPHVWHVYKGQRYCLSCRGKMKERVKEPRR